MLQKLEKYYKISLTSVISLFLPFPQIKYVDLNYLTHKTLLEALA